jgi:homoserine O-acetyltransferase
MIKRSCATVGIFLGFLGSGTAFSGPSFAQSHVSADAGVRPWDRDMNPAAVQVNAWFDNYKFRNGDTLKRLKIHYATLGTPNSESR